MIVEWWPRPLGLDSGACFCCPRSDSRLRTNFAAFVATKAEGEAIVKMIGRGARLDYRGHEPGWIQVKVSACAEHETNLEMLHLLDAVSPEAVAVCRKERTDAHS